MPWGRPRIILIFFKNKPLFIPDQKSSWNRSIWSLQSWKLVSWAPFLISSRSNMVSGWIYVIKSTFLVKKCVFLFKIQPFSKIKKRSKIRPGGPGAEPPGNCMAFVIKIHVLDFYFFFENTPQDGPKYKGGYPGASCPPNLWGAPPGHFTPVWKRS